MTSQITIWTNEVEEEDVKAALPRLGKSFVGKSIAMDSTVLSKSLNEFLLAFVPVIEEQPKEISGYYLDEIELSLTINAQGGIELVGKLDAGVEAGIKVKLKRKKGK
jgi:hypothetical protein